MAPIDLTHAKKKKMTYRYKFFNDRSVQTGGGHIYFSENSALVTLSVQTDRYQQNNVNPNPMPQNTVSEQGLHCLPLIEEFLDSPTSSGMD